MSLSYAFEPSIEPLSQLTIGQLIEDCALDSSNKIACIFVDQNISKTYAQLNSDANRLASSLEGIGCMKGDRIGIWAPNCYEWLLTQYATAKIGAILVNINPGYRADELMYCLNLVECHTLICSQRFRITNYCDILNEISTNILNNGNGSEVHCEEIPSLKNLVMINNNVNESEMAPKNILRFDDLLSNGTQYKNNANYVPKGVIQFDDPINIQFTSGTTGRPKAATLTHRNIIQNAYFFGKRALEGLNSAPLRLCVPNPLYHCYGCVMGTIVVAQRRGTMVLPAPTFSAHKTLQSIQDYECNMLYGTPTMYIDILNSNPKQFNLNTLIRGIMSGAPCPPPLIENVLSEIPSLEHILVCHSHDCPINSMFSMFQLPYGTTETSPIVCETSIHDSHRHKLHSVGRPLDYLEIKVIDPITGAIRETGDWGEICIRGHCNFIGYWNQTNKTNDVLDSRYWYHSGDMGFMDESGYLFINGRFKDMIIRGGENIYPKEIEDFLMNHPSVAEAQVIGIPHKRLGEEVVAYIKLKKANSGLDSSALMAFCSGKISHFKIPKMFVFVDDFPRTISGKVQKFKLRQLFENSDKKSTDM